MADNTAQGGTATIAADDVTTLNGGASSGVLVQRVKNGYGDDGTYRDVSAAFPMPTASPDTLGTATALSALNAAATVTLNGQSTITFTVTGTYSATLTFEGQYPDGSWATATAYVAGDGTGLQTLSNNATQLRAVNYGFTAFRVRVSAYTSGTASVRFNVSYAVTPLPVPGLLPDASTFADARYGQVIMGRTAGSGATAIAKQIITDGDGQLMNSPRPADLAVTATGAAAAGVTLTLPAVTSKFHYISALVIQRYATAALTAAATPVVVTSTNLPGSLAWTFDTAGAIGTSVIQSYQFPDPLKSTAAGTATTIVAPVVTAGIWRITATYYAV